MVNKRWVNELQENRLSPALKKKGGQNKDEFIDIAMLVMIEKTRVSLTGSMLRHADMLRLDLIAFSLPSNRIIMV